MLILPANKNPLVLLPEDVSLEREVHEHDAAQDWHLADVACTAIGQGNVSASGRIVASKVRYKTSL